MNVNLNLKALFTVVMLLVVVAASAQTVEQFQYMRQFDNDAKVLYDRAKQYYDTEVAPVVKQLNAIPAERSEAEISQMRHDLQVAWNEYERLQYEEFAYSLRIPLEKLKTQLQLNGWKKFERGSEPLKQFDQEWNNSTYIQHLTSPGEEGIDVLNECVAKVTDLRLRSFDNCQQELEQVLSVLAPAGDPSAFNIASVRRQMEEYAEIINTLTSAFEGISNTNEQYNELGNQQYQLIENWYDIREELDKKILEACRYTLSAPCDERGAFNWMRSQVEPKLDSVFHKSYRERRDRYRVLLANYDQHTAEIEDFLNLIFVYVKAGQMTEARKDEIASSLQSLDYCKYYYAHRNEERAVSSPYLDGIISDFETMLGNYFVEGAGKYSELIERLRGDQQYFAMLEEGKRKIEEEERRRKERERIKNNGKAKETFTVNGVTFTMVKVNGGTFTMGATREQGLAAEDDEKPLHRVTLSNFYIGETEVNQELWTAVMGSNPSNWSGAKLPVEDVSLGHCQEFLHKLNLLTGMSFRLPTEAEWEFAARGGNKSRGYKYSGSNNVGAVAWYNANSGDKTHIVATKQANELGLYDMSGNVWEWCHDWYDNYIGSSQTNPTGPNSGTLCVLRGGSLGTEGVDCRVTHRDFWHTYDYGYDVGFRLAFGFTPLDSVVYAELTEKLNLNCESVTDSDINKPVTMPSFPGGVSALFKYIASHVKYPVDAVKNNISGKVIIQFVVEKDGKVGEVKVARGVNSDLDREAIRVVKSLPKFFPAKNANGDPVRVWYTVPVTFKLQGSN